MLLCYASHVLYIISLKLVFYFYLESFLFFKLSKYDYIFTGDLEDTDREGNGIPLQYSCLENPTDGGACVVLNSTCFSNVWCVLIYSNHK